MELEAEQLNADTQALDTLKVRSWCLRRNAKLRATPRQCWLAALLCHTATAGCMPADLCHCAQAGLKQLQHQAPLQAAQVAPLWVGLCDGPLAEAALRRHQAEHAASLSHFSYLPSRLSVCLIFSSLCRSSLVSALPNRAACTGSSSRGRHVLQLAQPSQVASQLCRAVTRSAAGSPVQHFQPPGGQSALAVCGCTVRCQGWSTPCLQLCR